MKKEEKYTSDLNQMIYIVILNSFGFFFLEFLIPFYASQVLSATGIEIGLIFSMNLIGHIISASFTGFLTDKINSKTKLILFGSFGRGIAYFILYIAFILNSLTGIMIGNFAIGFFVGFFWIPFDTLISEKSSKDHRATAFGKRNFAVGIGMLVGSLLGFPIFITLISITSNSFLIFLPIVFYGLSNFFAGILFHYKVDESIKFNYPETSNNKKGQKINQSILLGIIFISIVLFLANINGSLAKPFLNVYLLEVITDDPSVAVWLYLPAGIVSMGLSPLFGKLVDKIKPTLGITISSILGALITWFLINTNNIIIFAILLTLDTTVIHTANLVLQNLISRISLKHRGKVFGIFRLFLNVGNIIGPILGGFVWDSIGMKAPFLISIIVELCLIPFYIIAVYVLKPVLKEKYQEKYKKLKGANLLQ